MVSVIAIGSGVFGSYFEGIRVEARREILRIDLVCPGFFGWALIASLGLLSGCVDGNGARYWRQINWLIGVTEEIKSPCSWRGFEWLGYAPTFTAIRLTYKGRTLSNTWMRHNRLETW